MCGLYINNIKNVAIKYEFIDNTSLLDKVKYNRKTRILSDILLDIKYNKTPLFVEVE